jgi:hypothetical protein
MKIKNEPETIRMTRNILTSRQMQANPSRCMMDRERKYRMPARKLLIIIILILMFVAISTGGCTASGVTNGDTNPLPRPVIMAPPEPLPTPPPSGALSAANQFLNWYLNFGVDEDGMPLAPFEQGGHHTCECLTPAYEARIDAEVSVAPERRGVYDPIASGYDLIDSTTTSLFLAEEYSASVIAVLDGMDWSRQITIDLAYVNNEWLIDNIRGASIASPEGVTQLFYEWYLDYYHSHGNPLAEGAYKSSPYLSDAYIDWVNSVQTSFDNDGFDPFLMSRAIPTGANVMSVEVNGEQAIVLVNRFLMTPQPTPLVVHLEKQGVVWKIVDVTMEEGPATPAEVVESFYEWYLDYTGSSSAGELRNPLVDGAYHGSPFLTSDFALRIDELLKGMQGGGFDPFVCAQVIPNEIITDGTYLAEMYGPQFANQASVVVRTEFAGHVFTIDLVRTEQDENWLIEDIVCGNTPAGAVKAFYTWYQGCLEESPTCRAPDQNYSTSGFVTDAFVERVETLRAEFQAAGVSGYNPITMAQSDIPAYILDSLAESGEVAQVVLTNLAWNEHILLVDLVREGGSWKIDKIGFHAPNTPVGVTKAFFNQYISVKRFPLDPGVLYAFAPEKHLSVDLQQAVEAYLRSGMPAGEDPILLSDRIPDRIEVEEAVVSNASAVAVVALYYGEEEPHSLSVDLIRVDGLWRIAGIR